MPPYRTGLHKRKRDFDQNKSEEEVPVEKEESSLDSAGEEDLIKGAANAEGDDDESDSENEPDVAAASDGERDEVLFEDDADSILSDVDKETGDSAEDLSNSEEHSDTNESDDSDERHEGGEHSKEGKESTDSGAESEPVPDSSSEDSSSRQDTEPKKKGKRQTKSKHKKSESSVDKLADKINAGHINLQPVEQRDEYESGDTSDEEDRRTTVGDVPLHWYREYPHVGYDLEGRRVLRAPNRDAIDSFLKQCEDPEFWRTVRDPSTGQDVVLAREDLQLLQRLRAARPPADDQHEPWVEWFSRSVLATPLRAFPEHKRSFLPSRDEQRHVARLVHALRMGWAKTRKQIADERRKRKEKQFYDLWGGAGAEAEAARRGPRPVPAPRRAPPSHAESYNPPPEYLLDAREMAAWDALAETPWRRQYTFLPQRHASLRAVPAYPRYVRERFLRCLDLYLAPRAIKMRLTITPEQLVPQLPAPRDLQPFPTREYACLRGHTDLVRSVDFDPSGDYIVSGGDDNTVRAGRGARRGAAGRGAQRRAAARGARRGRGGGAGARGVGAGAGDGLGARRAAARAALRRGGLTGVARARRLRVLHGGGARRTRGPGAPAVAAPLAAPAGARQGPSAVRRLPPAPAAIVRRDAACGAHLRPGEAGAGEEAGAGRAVDQRAGGAPGGGQPAGGLLRPQVLVVRPGAILTALPNAAAARRRSAGGRLPRALPALRHRGRRPLPRGVARNGLQRPAAEPAAGAAEATGRARASWRPVRAGAVLAPDAAHAVGRRCRPHAAPLRVSGRAGALLVGTRTWPRRPTPQAALTMRAVCMPYLLNEGTIRFATVSRLDRTKRSPLIGKHNIMLYVVDGTFVCVSESL